MIMNRKRLSPSTTASNGRDQSGRFAPGNKAAKGNPHARRVARLRAALLNAVTPEDIAAVVRALVRKAKKGDVAAIRELLDRAIGRSAPGRLLEPLQIITLGERIIAARLKELDERDDIDNEDAVEELHENQLEAEQEGI